ncbi:high-affinity zinc transporter membrane component [uncultured Blautia sp.]|nr:high-affinity zinc transporter membrane component [uncultured Blautia sp.]
MLFYHKLFAVTFDESFSQATGLRVDWYNTLLAILTALTIVLGMRMMGAMLISSLVIFPALTAMRLFKSFRGYVRRVRYVEWAAGSALFLDLFRSGKLCLNFQKKGVLP